MLLERHSCVVSYSKCFRSVSVRYPTGVLLSMTLGFGLGCLFPGVISVRVDLDDKTFVWNHGSSV